MTENKAKLFSYNRYSTDKIKKMELLHLLLDIYILKFQ